MKTTIAGISIAAVLGALAAGVPVFEEGVPQTRCGGVGVTAYAGTWIYDGAPDILDDASFQQGNDSPREKVAPLPSQKLRSNYFGVNTTRMPCLKKNIYLPEEAVHLIDGDLGTCWLSEAQPRAQMQPIVVRIDLAKEAEISKIVLMKRPLSPETARRKTDRQPTKDGCEVGRGMPVEMSAAVSCDAWQWEEVFSGATGDEEAKESFEISFAPRRAKQVKLTATKLCHVEFFLYAMSLAEIEVVDAKGRNVALVSRGATIAVNATRHDEMPPNSQSKALWATQWDMGAKWIRVGYHDDPINWHRVERVKGRLEVDPVADAAVTACKEHGQNVIMCLNFGNRLYSGPEKRQFTQLAEWNWCMPNPPTTKEALEAWDRYVVFMCNHFKDRVHSFEIWNEWNISVYWGTNPDTEAYCEIVRRTIPLLRRHAPNCKVMLGSTSGAFGGIASQTPAQIAERERKDQRFVVWKRFAKDVDEIGYHPFYNPRPGSLLRYTDDIRAFRAWLARQGFTGTLHASEWNINGRATPLDPSDARNVWCGTYTQSEVAKAKEVLQQMVRHAGFGIPSCFCEAYQAFYAQTELSLFKGSLLQDPVAPLQPTATYYALRNAAAQMDGFEPADFKPELAGIDGKSVAAFAFADGGRRGVAVWYEDDKRADDYRQIPATLTLPFAAGELWACDPVNGVRQRLVAAVDGGRTVVKGLMVGDAPLFIVENCK